MCLYFVPLLRLRYAVGIRNVGAFLGRNTRQAQSDRHFRSPYIVFGQCSREAIDDGAPLNSCISTIFAAPRHLGARR